ncbi:MAG: hypothetical protein ACI3V1_06375 [Faecousia sp.]
MTVAEAVERIDSIVRNTYTREEKIFWLSNLDAQIATFILHTTPPEKYKDGEDLNTDLLVGAPFDVMYIHWLEAQIAYCNSEIERYNNAITMYQQEYNAYASYYARQKAPEKVTTMKYF